MQSPHIRPPVAALRLSALALSLTGKVFATKGQDTTLGSALKR